MKKLLIADISAKTAKCADTQCTAISSQIISVTTVPKNKKLFLLYQVVSFWNQRGLNSGSDSWAVLRAQTPFTKQQTHSYEERADRKLPPETIFGNSFLLNRHKTEVTHCCGSFHDDCYCSEEGKRKRSRYFPFWHPRMPNFPLKPKSFRYFLGCFSLESAKAGKAVEGQLSPVHWSFPFSYLAFLLHLFPQLHLDTPPPSSVSLTPRQGQQYLSSDAVLTVRLGLVEVQSELWLPCLFDSEKYPNYVKDWELMFSSCPPTRSCLIPLLLVRSPLLYFLLPPSPYTPLRGRTVFSLRFNSPKHGNLLWQKVLNGEEAKQQTGHVVWKFSQSLWPNCDL